MPSSSPLSLGLFGTVGSLKSLTHAQILAQPNPKPGRLVYDNTNQLIRFYNGSTWEAISSGSTSVQQKAANFSSLSSGTYVGEIAYVNQSEGTQWLPGGLGGSYYPAGWYLWDGSDWVSDRNSIVDQLQLNVDGLGNKADIGHSHTKSDITDFSDADYATPSQGALADSATQPGDNISTLNNDSLFISEADLGIDGLSDAFNKFTYGTDGLEKIETFTDNTETTLIYTKAFTYTTGTLTQITLTNESTNDVETKDLAYDGSGNLTSITLS